MQKDPLGRNRGKGKTKYCGTPKGNKRKNLRKDKRKVLLLQKGKGNSTLAVTEGSLNQLPLAERGQDSGLN